MKVAKVRAGEKFVLDDRGGVWEKIDENEKGEVKARCFFGPRGVFGTEIIVDPNAYCYVFLEQKSFSREAGLAPEGSGTKIRVVDEGSDELIREVMNPTASQFSAMSSAETIRFVPPGKRRARVYQVSEFCYDLDEDAFYLMVMPEQCGGKDEDAGHN